MTKVIDMMLSESHRGLLGVNVFLYNISPRTKRPTKNPDKSFHIALKEDQKRPKESDYKEIVDYIKDNNINILNEDEFKWLT